MLAVLIIPILPIFLIWVAKKYQKQRKMTGGEMLLRYTVYIAMILFASAIILGLMKDDNTSLLVKLNRSAPYAVKFVCLEIALTISIMAAEWLLFGARLAEKLSWEKVRSAKGVSIFNKYVAPFLIYVLAAVVILLNVSMMFDSVVWGDEAFSANTAKKSMFGIMQVLYYWDNHPPFHYYWLKMFGEIFGHTVPVYHLASLVPFIGGILLAVTAFRKRFGNIPAAFFVMVSGLGAACLEYNLEIRMYSLAFCGVLATYYCAYKVICSGKRSSWVSMVLWALMAAYSHYYALVAVGILLFCTAVAVWLKHRGKSWLKGLGAIVSFLVGYAPWLFFLFRSMKSVSNNWWMTDVLGFDLSLNMVMGSDGISTLLFPLLVLLLAVLLLAESSVFSLEVKDGEKLVRVQKPCVKKWSDETYATMVGAFTIIGTMTFAYLLCYLMRPMLAERYMYPMSAVSLATLVVASSRVLVLLKKLGEEASVSWLEAAGKAVLVAFLATFFVIGIGNYQKCSSLVWDQNAKTVETLAEIGEPQEDVQFITNNVKHLAWTVLYHYYPNNEIAASDYNSIECDRFWYFNSVELNEDDLDTLKKKGYEVTYHGYMQLSQYPFNLYYIERTADTSQ